MALFFTTEAQSLSNWRKRTLSIQGDSVVLDSLSIAPGSFRLSDGNKSIDTSAYELDWVRSVLIWKKNAPAFKDLVADSLQASYRVFSFLFSAPVTNKGLSLIGKGGAGQVTYYTPSTGQPELFRMQGLTKNGSISRGITFGNNQDVFVNSSLNLQLAGKLSDNVEILAAITDENIPIQPEGNTQQLQDFDRVFIQLSKDRNKLIAGDFDLRRPDSYFMNFLKRGQGASFTGQFHLNRDTLSKKRLLRSGAAVAVSKGRFTRQQLSVVEGNQGPYRLNGNNGESFIIVLAGSERVFLDGFLLNRGVQNDYIIDYNTAEITFTARRLITKDVRIYIEFEYTDRNYARSLLYANNEFESDKIRLKFNAYSEQDSKNQPLTLELDSTKKQLMSNVGDSIQNAFYFNADSVEFNSSNVLYQKKDTVVGGTVYSIFVYSTDPDSAYWRVTFSNVGANKGNYVQEINAANGRVYKWIQPLNGIPQGNFEPVTLLVTPKQQQLFTFGTDVKLNNSNSLTTEIAMSKYDVNLFSSRDKSNDLGYAGRAIYSMVLPFSVDTSKGWRLQNSFSYEFTNKNFRQLERFRNVEFERDWNLNASSIIGREDIVGLQTMLVNPLYGQLTYQFKSYTKGAYTGIMNSANTKMRWKKFQLIANGSYLSTDGLSSRSRFIRHYADIARPFWKVIVGLKENTEFNRFFSLDTNLLLANSYSWQDFQGYITKADSSKSKAGISYRKRIDQLPSNNTLRQSAVADEVYFYTDFSSNPRNALRTVTTYRSLNIKDTTLTAQIPGKILLNRIDHTAVLFKGVVSLITYYEVGTGQERKQEYYYLEVPAGQGIYAYLGDLNGNNVKDLDEFATAAFAFQAKYIRVYVQTTDFVRTRTNQFSEVLTITPAGNRSFVQGKTPFLYRFSNQLSVRMDKKTMNENIVQSLNPFSRTIDDTSLVSVSSNFRNILFFNRTNPIYGVDFTWQDNRNKILLANGFESRVLRSGIISARYNISRTWLLNFTWENGEKNNRSQFFTSRDYSILYNSLEPKITLQPGNVFRLSTVYRYSDKFNSIGSKEKTFIHRFTLDAKYTTVNSGNISARFSLVKVSFNGDANSFLTYELLEGFKPGQNLTWGAAAQRNLGTSMQLSLNYDGTKLQGSSVVHTGGVQFRAFF